MMELNGYIPKKELQRVSKDGSPLVSAEKIISAVETYFGVDRDTMLKKCRKRDILYPRQVSMYLLAHYSGLTMVSIGVIFNKDHTTVIHSLEAIDDWLATDENVKRQIEVLVKKIKEKNG